MTTQPSPSAACSTCEGTGTVHIQGEIGAPGVGGDIPCPDCTGSVPSAASDDAALEELITTLREGYRDAFGRYPSERQMEDFLEEHPGALDLWREVSRHV